MKGAALTVCPELTLVDISHEVAPHDIAEAAQLLAASYHYFPGRDDLPDRRRSRRRVVAPRARGRGRRLRFVAPDNGVMTAVFRDHPPRRVVELTERRFFRPTVSRTFEGRDRFAPAAAWLARGVDVARARPSIDSTRAARPAAGHETGDVLTGAVLRADRFGNVITSIDRRQLRALRPGPRVHARRRRTPIARLVGTYADIGDDEVCALFGSTDLLELAARSPQRASGSASTAGDTGARPSRRQTQPRARATRFGVGGVKPRETAHRACASIPLAGRAYVFMHPADSRPDPARWTFRTGFDRGTMIDFDLTDEHRLLEQTRARMGGPRHRSRASRRSTASIVSIRRSFPRMAELGLLGICVPEAFGGAGMDYISLGWRVRSSSTSIRRCA